MGEDFSVRVDKWLWAVRIFKTRSDAADACRTNRVLINGAFVKPSREIKVGDTVTVKKMPVTYTYRVAAMVSSRQPAKNVPDYVENLTSQAELDKLHIPKLTVFVQRDRGTGRPTKRERREIDSLMGEIYLDDDSETSGDSQYSFSGITTEERMGMRSSSLFYNESGYSSRSSCGTSTG